MFPNFGENDYIYKPRTTTSDCRPRLPRLNWIFGWVRTNEMRIYLKTTAHEASSNWTGVWRVWKQQWARDRTRQNGISAMFKPPQMRTQKAYPAADGCTKNDRSHSHHTNAIHSERACEYSKALVSTTIFYTTHIVYTHQSRPTKGIADKTSSSSTCLAVCWRACTRSFAGIIGLRRDTKDRSTSGATRGDHSNAAVHTLAHLRLVSSIRRRAAAYRVGVWTSFLLYMLYNICVSMTVGRVSQTASR